MLTTITGMNKLTTAERAQILTALVEGMSMSATARLFKVSKITILRLLADAGTLAAQFHDLTVRDLATKRAQLDEIWSFVHSKEKHVRDENCAKGYGDNWTWVAIDSDSKLVVNWLVGGRDAGHAWVFVNDLAARVKGRMQITTDGLPAYRQVVEGVFGDNVDYAVVVKEYAAIREGYARYSPPRCIGVEKHAVCGAPLERDASTSFVERQNLTMRMSMRRFTRLTNGFSKKPENHKHAIALHYFHYNFIRKHQTIKTTPAVMAGVADKVWTMDDFVVMMEREEALLGGRLTDYKPAASKKRKD